MFWLGKTIDTDLENGGKKNRVNLSPLEVLILAQLRSRELRSNTENLGQYGYSMIQELDDLFAGSWKAQSGTIYPILSKLQTQKHLIHGEKKNSPLGPVKKVYHLTELGRKIIDHVISDNFNGDIEFISRYLKMITPFTLISSNNHSEIFKEGDNFGDSQEFRDSLEFISHIPHRMIKNLLEKAKTETDISLRKRQIEIIKIALKQTLDELDDYQG